MVHGVTPCHDTCELSPEPALSARGCGSSVRIRLYGYDCIGRGGRLKRCLHGSETHHPTFSWNDEQPGYGF
jgi:hypothetical protein